MSTIPENLEPSLPNKILLKQKEGKRRIAMEKNYNRYRSGIF